MGLFRYANRRFQATLIVLVVAASLLSGCKAPNEKSSLADSQADRRERIACLQQLNIHIDGCSTWYWQMLGKVDSCIKKFDDTNPRCRRFGDTQESAQALTAAERDIGTDAVAIADASLQMLGGVGQRLVRCAAGAGAILYTSAETGKILVCGEGFQHSLTDQQLEGLASDCRKTAATAAVAATAVVASAAAPLAASYVLAGATLTTLTMQVGRCYDACYRSNDQRPCVSACQKLGSEALAMVEAVALGQAAQKVIPKSFFEPKAFGYEVRGFRIVAIELDGIPPPNPQTYDANARIRQWYNDRVGKIPLEDQHLATNGASLEARAQQAWGIRHSARIEARNMMPDKTEVAALQHRDMAKYSNPDGPTFDQLVNDNVKAGASLQDAYRKIIGSSVRTDPATNQNFGSQAQ